MALLQFTFADHGSTSHYITLPGSYFTLHQSSMALIDST